MSRLLVVGLTCAVVSLVLLWALQDRLVYGTATKPYPVDRAAADIADVPYRTADGLELHGWLVRHRAAPTGCAGAEMVVVFHGTHTDMTWGYPLAERLAGAGYDVFLAEYRGFGVAPGSPSEQGLRLDARAAFDAARGLAEDPTQTPTVVGISLGTGVAVTLASEIQVGGLVLVAPYTSLPDVAWAELPGLPYRLLMRDRFETIDRIGLVDAPTLVVLGTDDEVIPPELSRTVHSAAGRPDRIIEHEGLDHLEIIDAVARTDDLTDALDRWRGCRGR